MTCLTTCCEALGAPKDFGRVTRLAVGRALLARFSLGSGMHLLERKSTLWSNSSRIARSLPSLALLSSPAVRLVVLVVHGPRE